MPALPSRWSSRREPPGPVESLVLVAVGGLLTIIGLGGLCTDAAFALAGQTTTATVMEKTPFGVKLEYTDTEGVRRFVERTPGKGQWNNYQIGAKKPVAYLPLLPEWSREGSGTGSLGSHLLLVGFGLVWTFSAQRYLTRARRRLEPSAGPDPQSAGPAPRTT